MPNKESDYRWEHLCQWNKYRSKDEQAQYEPASLGECQDAAYSLLLLTGICGDTIYSCHESYLLPCVTVLDNKHLFLFFLAQFVWYANEEKSIGKVCGLWGRRIQRALIFVNTEKCGRFCFLGYSPIILNFPTDRWYLGRKIHPLDHSRG